MESRDGTMGFDQEGTVEDVRPTASFSYRLTDGPRVRTRLTPDGDGTHVQRAFDADANDSATQQRDGWQAIMDTFRAYAEAR